MKYLSFATLALISNVRAGKCPFGFDEPAPATAKPIELAQRHIPEVLTVDFSKHEHQWPKDLFSCSNGNKFETPSDFTYEDYDMISDALIRDYETQFSFDPLVEARYAACIVRYTGHDFMDFDIADDGSFMGGNDGCMDMFDPAQKGVEKCLRSFKILELYERVCSRVSLADFGVIIGNVIQGRLALDYDPNDKISDKTLLGRFRNTFRFGRRTESNCEHSAGKLPNPGRDCTGPEGSRSVSDVFINRLYHELPSDEAWECAAAILGSHTFGGSNAKNSGIDGLWSSPTRQSKFDNSYHDAIIKHGWAPEEVVINEAGDKRQQWMRVDAGAANDDDILPQFMLNTDMCLMYDIKEVKEGGDLECCLYTEPWYYAKNMVVEACGTVFRGSDNFVPTKDIED